MIGSNYPDILDGRGTHSAGNYNSSDSVYKIIFKCHYAGGLLLSLLLIVFIRITV